MRPLLIRWASISILGLFLGLQAQDLLYVRAPEVNGSSDAHRLEQAPGNPVADRAVGPAKEGRHFPGGHQRALLFRSNVHDEPLELGSLASRLQRISSGDKGPDACGRPACGIRVTPRPLADSFAVAFFFIFSVRTSRPRSVLARQADVPRRSSPPVMWSGGCFEEAGRCPMAWCRSDGFRSVGLPGQAGTAESLAGPVSLMVLMPSRVM